MIEHVQSNPTGVHSGAISRFDIHTLEGNMAPDRKTYPMPQRPPRLPDKPLPLREQLQHARQEREDAERAAFPQMIDRMQAAIAAFQEATKRDIPTQHLVVFLTVGRNPGKSQIEYARMLPTQGKQSTVSRQLTDLSIELRTREPGYGLLEFRTNVRNRRENIYTLSPKGAALYERLIRILEG